jgi:hypothetical protein
MLHDLDFEILACTGCRSRPHNEQEKSPHPRADQAYTARLTEPSRDEVGRILVPERAAIEGHLLRVQTYLTPAEVEVVLRPEAIGVGERTVSFRAIRDWARVVAESRHKGIKGVQLIVTERDERFSGAYRFTGTNVIIPAGFRSEWRTVTDKSRPLAILTYIPHQLTRLTSRV